MFLIGSWKDGQALFVWSEEGMQQSPKEQISFPIKQGKCLRWAYWFGVALKKNCSVELKEYLIVKNPQMLEETTVMMEKEEWWNQFSIFQEISILTMTKYPVYYVQQFENIFIFKMTLLSQKSNGSNAKNFKK